MSNFADSLEQLADQLRGSDMNLVVAMTNFGMTEFKAPYIKQMLKSTQRMCQCSNCSWWSLADEMVEKDGQTLCEHCLEDLS